MNRCFLVGAVGFGILSAITALAAVPGPIPLVEMFPGAQFSPAVPTPEAVLGADPGQRPLRPHEVYRYMEALAASPRASLVEYARSHEGRPLGILIVSDEATAGRLEEFRREHLRRMDPRGRRPEQDAGELAGAKAVAWMAYGIHGDELSSPDAAVALAYWLVAGEDDQARAIRRDLVVIIDPNENPDGRERYLAQITAFSHSRPNPDTEDLSHTGAWPWGRGNHYLFDLNRDWFAMVHPESRRSAVIASWLPQLMVDSHEMGPHDTYLFSPSRHPFNPHKPAMPMAWAGRFAADQATALDRRAYPYYTREWNEEFFPGYGSAWATYLGSVGILYEMSRTTGALVAKRTGEIRTFSQAVEHQVISSVANLLTLQRNREALLAQFVASRREVVRLGSEGPVRAWLLLPRPEATRADRLAQLLRSQGIEVLRAAAPVRVAAARHALTGDSSTVEVPAGTWMVPMDQPNGALARTLLDPHVPMNAAFFTEERRSQEKGEGTKLYEVTAWSLPLMWGVEAYWTGARPSGAWESGEAGKPSGTVMETPGAVGFVVDTTPDAGAGALADLLQRGLSVRLAEKPFTVAGRSFPSGVAVLRVEGNPGDLSEHLAAVADRWGVTVTGLPTGKAGEGPDLGGRHFPLLVAPRVGVLTGSPIAPTGYGAVWHLLDRLIDLRFNALDVGRLARGVDLERYNVLVFPPLWGGAEIYRALLGEEGAARLRRWVEGGGTVIGIGAGAEFLADTGTGLTRTRLRRQALDRFPSLVLSIDALSAVEAGPWSAAGMRPSVPPETPRRGDTSGRESPYDVAPVLGAGARPFAAGHPQGTPVTSPPLSLAEWLKPVLPPGRERPEPSDIERADARLRRFSPRGALLRAQVDTGHWLAWGLPEQLPVLAHAADTLVAEPPVEVPVRFADLGDLHLGGLLWPEAAARLARTGYVTRESSGRGQVILFLNEPEFRAQTPATRRLLVNAILVAPGLGTNWPTPWSIPLAWQGE